jgi:plasmid stabilization system protein ParE
MGLPVIITPQAQEDLRRIVSHVAKDSRERAFALGNRLIDRALKVGSFPGAGRMVTEEQDPAVREVIHESYRIIYEVLSDPPHVYVLRFWHAARGLAEIREGGQGGAASDR